MLQNGLRSSLMFPVPLLKSIFSCKALFPSPGEWFQKSQSGWPVCSLLLWHTDFDALQTKQRNMCMYSNVYVCRHTHTCTDMHKTIYSYINSTTNPSCMDLFCLSLNSDPNGENPGSNHLPFTYIMVQCMTSKNGCPIFPWNTTLPTRTQRLCTIVSFAVSIMLLKFFGSECFLQRFIIQFNSWMEKHCKTWMLLLLLHFCCSSLCVSIYTVTNVCHVSAITAIYGVWFRFMAINVSVKLDLIMKNRNSSLSGGWSRSIASSRYAWAT